MNLFSRAFKNNQGQILLIMILTLVVVLTVGLSVASRSITNVKISTQSEESSRAFQAAEAGIEQVLQEYADDGRVTSETDDIGNNARFSSTLDAVDGTQFLVGGGSDISQNIGADVQLAPSSGYRVNVFFTSPDQTDCSSASSNPVPAVEVLVLENPSNPTMRKFLADPCGALRSNTQGSLASSTITSTTITSGGASQAFRYSVTVPPAAQPPISNGYVMKVIPIYNSTKVGVQSTVALPDQGKIIDSTGSSGETVRKLQYFESLPEIPVELFQYAIMSQ